MSNSKSTSCSSRKAYPSRATAHSRTPRSTESNVNTASGNASGGNDRSGQIRRGRQKNTVCSKGSSVGARMSAGSAILNKKERPCSHLQKERLISHSQSPTKTSSLFGPPVPDIVLDDICFRFLINIPDDQKMVPIRMCFQIELAHWFYIDFYCKANISDIKCPDVSLRDFIGQVFCHCDFLVKYAKNVDMILEEWRVYKSSVPTYGAALLDRTLNYVLLVQGYFAKSSWGFPKGKVNEEEEAMACARREVMEEVGYDISDKICKTRLIQTFVNDTLIRLYIIRDVPIDFPFAPKTRNEIGKIQWFSIWDLPKDKYDISTCERIGMNPNCFYTVMPFVRELQAYVLRYQSMQSRPKQKPMDAVSIGARSSSAFSPVLPHRKNEATLPAALTPLLAGTKTASPVDKPVVSHHVLPYISSPDSAFFKPLVTSAQQVSYTGTAFVRMMSSGASCTNIQENFKMNEVTRPVPTVPKISIPSVGRPVYDAFRDEAQEKKLNAELSIKACPPDTLDQVAKEEPDSEKDDVDKFKTSSVGIRFSSPLKSVIPPLTYTTEKDILDNSMEESDNNSENTTSSTSVRVNSRVGNTQIVKLCDAWKNFKFDVSHLL